MAERTDSPSSGADAEDIVHQDALQAARAQIEMLSTRTPAGIFQIDAEGRPVFLNEMVLALTGLPPERLAGNGWIDAVHPGDRARVAALWKEAWQAGTPFHAELRLGPGPEETWVLATARTLRGNEGKVTGVMGVITDITESRELAARLSRAERMASVGTLAAGMAHEVNNPMAAVISALSFASAGLVEHAAEGDGLAEVRQALADGLDAGRRVGGIVRDLMAFAEAHDAGQEADVAAAVRDAAGELPEPLRRRARLVLDLGQPPAVEASASQLQRVVQHLLGNAFLAIPEERAGAGEVRASTGTAADGRAFIEIRDDGTGIAPEQLAHLCEPFYTTRKVGRGAGLGLAVCHGLVSAMAGEMEAESSPGKGSTFRVLLPAARRAGPETAPTPWPPLGHGAATAVASPAAPI